MWIVRLAIKRPYTFIVLALLILVLSPVVISRTPTDIFPEIKLPVIAVAWQYTGLNPEEMEGRFTTTYERLVTSVVDDVDHMESTTVAGQASIKIFLHEGASVDRAIAQVLAISQDTIKFLPAGALPPLIVNYNASTVPILQLALSGEGLYEQQLNDIGLNFLRTQLVTVPGAAVPFPYGGKQTQVMINLDNDRLQSKGLSPADIVTAFAQQNLVVPSGTVKIGEFEYNVDQNASPRTVAELNDLPIKQVGASTIYLRDVAQVSQGFAPQTNVVRHDGRRGVLISILNSSGASTLAIVRGIRAMLPHIAQTLPPQLNIQLVADQAIFVQGAITGVIREAVIAACLTALMILLFLGSWRSTLIIGVSIPLSILTSVMALSLLGETINLMTLGGLALAVGILVDDATVTIENISRHLEEGQELDAGILNGASQIALPALVSTLSICIVFAPMFMLSGVPRYLFVPLAEAVVFAMLASYVLSRTLVPTLAMYLLKKRRADEVPSRNPLARIQRGFARMLERTRQGYQRLLTLLVRWRAIFIPGFLACCLSAFLLVPWLGRDFFPSIDSGQILLHVRAKSGTRIEETARLVDRVENSIRRVVPADELGTILDNIGLPYSVLNFMYCASGTVGRGDADILVTLKGDHRPASDFMRELRTRLPEEFPGTTFAFLPANMVEQILNFGIPAPIDVQIEGADIEGNRKVANEILSDLRQVPGLTDLRIQQTFDSPKLHVDIDRTKASQGGYTASDVAQSLLVSLSGSFQTNPQFFLNWNNGVSYSIATMTPQYDMTSLQDIQNIPLTPSNTGSGPPEGDGLPPGRAGILADVASITRSSEMGVLSHYNIRRVVDIYASVQDRDLGAVGREVQRIVDAHRSSLPRGSFVSVRGQLATMRTSYAGLLGGLAFSVVLVYLLIVVNFQSWADPFIIITALPAALAGIVLFLFVTHTTLSVPALMGAITAMGVATANSILVITFARERLEHHADAKLAAIEAGFTRFRPVLMTALAMIIGMIPMALGLGDGGEQNAPLGRAVIGGLLLATVATLFFVPTVFSVVHARHRPVTTPAPPATVRGPLSA